MRTQVLLSSNALIYVFITSTHTLSLEALL